MVSFTRRVAAYIDYEVMLWTMVLQMILVYCPACHKVIRKNNEGPASARNAGAWVAKGSLLAFTDADCVPSPSWLKNLTQPFTNPEVVGVKGTYCTTQTALVARFVQLEYEYKYVRMLHKASIDFIDTYSAAYRRDIFIQNGGFNESFPFPSVEDQEFSFRLARKGYLMVFSPTAVVYHHHDRNIHEYLRRKFGIGYWKAIMLRWIPEKTFSDSHTAPTQRLEIILLALALATIPLILIWPLYAFVFLLTLMGTFLLSISPFLVFIGKDDPKVLWIAVGMLFLRAGSLGMGLLKGLIHPPKSASGDSNVNR
jgi:cellulose synthase/poly-beta-1,6-N-acetylglucosamine synthase-like glycosyltransferase